MRTGTPELFLVAEAATFVVTVDTCGETVVPGTVVTASAVMVGTVLPPETVTKADVVLEMTEGEMVVPGMVVVYVTYCPSAVAAIALPVPAAVYCVGSLSVAVFGGVAGVP